MHVYIYIYIYIYMYIYTRYLVCTTSVFRKNKTRSSDDRHPARNTQGNPPPPVYTESARVFLSYRTINTYIQTVVVSGYHGLTPIGPQSRVGDKPVRFRVFLPPNGTAVLKGLKAPHREKPSQALIQPQVAFYFLSAVRNKWFLW